MASDQIGSGLLGLSFMPNGENAEESMRSQHVPQEAIRLLALRPPTVFGARSPIPQSIFFGGPQGTGGLQGMPENNAMIQNLRRILGLSGGGAPSAGGFSGGGFAGGGFPGAPGVPSAPSMPGAPVSPSNPPSRGGGGRAPGNPGAPGVGGGFGGDPRRPLSGGGPLPVNVIGEDLSRYGGGSNRA